MDAQFESDKAYWEMQHAEMLNILSYTVNLESVNWTHGYIYINGRAITTRPKTNIDFTLLFNSDYFCFFLSPRTEITLSLALKCYSSHIRDIALFQSSATSVKKKKKHKLLKNLQENSLASIRCKMILPPVSETCSKIWVGHLIGYSRESS